MKKIRIYDDKSKYSKLSYEAYNEDTRTKHSDCFFRFCTVCPSCGAEHYSVHHAKNTESYFGIEYCGSRAFNKKVLLPEWLKTCELCGEELSDTPGYFFHPGYNERYSVYEIIPRDDIQKIFRTVKHNLEFNECFIQEMRTHGYSENEIEIVNRFIWSFNSTKEPEQVWVDDAFTPSSVNDLFLFLKFWRDRFVYPIKAENALQKFIDGIIPYTAEVRSVNMKSEDNGFLIRYLKSLISVETDIVLLKSRLKSLYAAKEREKPLLVNAKNPWYEKRMIQEIRQNLLELNNEKQKYQSLDFKQYMKSEYEQFLIGYISQSDTKPQMPVLKKSNLFNKKKIDQENAVLQKEYEEELAAWENKENERQKNNEMAIQRAKEKAKQLDLESLRRIEYSIAEAEKELISYNNLLDQKSTTNVVKSFWEDEISTVEKLMIDCIRTKEELESYDVIYGKYRDIVAYSSFYDYFMSGRCDCLQGPSGAYNLFESELRMNLVIGKLSDILVSLDRIQQNQFMLYNQMQRMNITLNKLSNSMSNVEKNIGNILANVENINDNTTKIAENSDVIAYNSAVTATYTRITAELTDALGYMVALK